MNFSDYLDTKKSNMSSSKQKRKTQKIEKHEMNFDNFVAIDNKDGTIILVDQENKKAYQVNLVETKDKVQQIDRTVNKPKSMSSHARDIFEGSGNISSPKYGRVVREAQPTIQSGGGEPVMIKPVRKEITSDAKRASSLLI